MMTFGKLTMTLFALALLSGCVKPASECDWTRPIRPGASDVLSTDTARQILAHNTKGARFCGWVP